MSKHFELMQQMAKERTFRSAPVEESVITMPSTKRDTSSHLRWANDEALRLVQQVFLLQTQEPPRVVVFAGIDHGNGCSQICASVAETLAQNSRRPVCIVETNFRTPSLPGLFRTTNHYGLTDALLYDGPVNAYLKSVYLDKLWLLSSGTLAEDSPNLLTSERLSDRINELRQQFEFVIVDAPPLSRYSDALAVGQLSDGVVLILEAGSTRREVASAVTANLRSANIPILAAVLNKRSFPIPEGLYNKL